MLGLVTSILLSEADSQETTLFVALGFNPVGPAAGTAAASLMTWLGGTTGIQVGSTYAAVQAAAMGGPTVGVAATVGGMTVGGLAAAAAVPLALIGGVVYAWN